MLKSQEKVLKKSHMDNPDSYDRVYKLQHA